MKMYLSSCTLRSHFVREFLYQEMISLQKKSVSVSRDVLFTKNSFKRTAKLLSTRPRKKGYSWPRQQRSWREEFVMDSGASMHVGSKRDVNSGELVTMRTSRIPTMVMMANGVVQTKGSDVVCESIGLVRQSYAS